MPYSMTAFARAAAHTTWGELTCELRSVNHRFLEMNFRLAEEIRHLEPRIRELIGAALNRGRIDCNVRFSLQPELSGDIPMNRELVAKLLAGADQLHALDPRIGALRAADILSWPGVVQEPEVDVDSIGEAALSAVRDAVRELVATRAREGDRLASILAAKRDAAVALVTEVRADLPAWTEGFRARLEERILKAKADLDPERLEQEVVIYVQKSDVTEEIDRLLVHLEEVRRVLGQQKPAGRRLDFLMQELNREANTLGSKSIDARLTQASVEIKVLIEQMREQVQNIE